ncbi:MAG: peptide ABC transporter permease, partial [Cutibacterium sp.]|nr:peptide ABC transporter permease [Cutibacterium sp.]
FLFPAGILVILLLSVNFIGDALRDALDPSSQSGGQA